jgi:hypothetical protein
MICVIYARNRLSSAAHDEAKSNPDCRPVRDDYHRRTGTSQDVVLIGQQAARRQLGSHDGEVLGHDAFNGSVSGGFSAGLDAQVRAAGVHRHSRKRPLLLTKRPERVDVDVARLRGLCVGGSDRDEPIGIRCRHPSQHDGVEQADNSQYGMTGS